MTCSKCLVKYLISVTSVISLPLATQYWVSGARRITNSNVLMIVVQEVQYSWPHQCPSKCLDNVEYKSDTVDHLNSSGHAKRVPRIQLVCAYKCGYKDLFDLELHQTINNPFTYKRLSLCLG